jgi:hypothetical protein
MIQSVKNTIHNLKQLDLETLNTLKIMMFVFIVVDMVGVYWYLELKKLAVALLIVLMGCLTIILLLERRKQPIEKMSKKKKKDGNRKERIEQLQEKLNKLKQKEDIQEKDTEEIEEQGMFGLPDPDEYEKRAQKALGSWDFYF